MVKKFVKIYKNAKDIVLVTNISDYDDFLTEAAHNDTGIADFINSFSDEKEKTYMLKRLLFEIVEISCKLKGYKAEKVMQNNLYACGEKWPDQSDSLFTKENNKERLKTIIYTLLAFPQIAKGMYLDWNSTKDCENYNYIYLLNNLLETIINDRYYKRNDIHYLPMLFDVREEFTFFSFFKTPKNLEIPTDIDAFCKEISILTNSPCEIEGDQKDKDRYEECLSMIIQNPDIVHLIDDNFIEYEYRYTFAGERFKDIVKLIKNNEFNSKEAILQFIRNECSQDDSDNKEYYQLIKILADMPITITKKEMEEKIIEVVQELIKSRTDNIKVSQATSPSAGKAIG